MVESRVTTSVGYAGSSDRIVHFGLGRDTTIAKIEVEWPSGLHTVLHNVTVDQYLYVEEQ